jgi:penicillin-binding protein 2
VTAIDVRSERLLERRRTILLVIVAGSFIILAFRLFYLQVFKNEHYSKLALSNRIQKEDIPAPRGLIKSRRGAKLVVNVPVYQISILPKRIPGREDRMSLACRWLGIDEEELTTSLTDWTEKYPDGREMTVVQAADKEQISILSENRALFPFFSLEMKHRREFLEQSLAAHLLGYTGEVSDTELRESGDFKRGDIIGRTGVEYIYEDYLRGQYGVRIVEISAEGTRIGEYVGLVEDERLEGRVESRPPVPGHDVYLTINIKLQRAAEEIFDWDKGALVAMDPESGAVLAAVSRPVYDPNIFIRGVSAEDWQELNGNPDKPLFNRCVQATYPPASTFKLMVAYACLKTRAASTAERFQPCYGGYQFGNRYFRCWKPEGHGYTNLFEAIVNSCDVYFYQLSEKLEADDFAYTGRLFGFGRKTEIDLPSEARGILPDKSYYDRKFGKGKWTRGHLLNYSIGQGDALATPVQLCLMTAMIANGGRRVRPHIVDRIEDSEGRVMFVSDRSAEAVSQIDRNLLKFIMRSMKAVVDGETGTGRAAAIPDFAVCGKTGTAQNPHGADHALFVAYAPADNPEIALAIVLEHAGHGGAMAAPMAGRILSAYFNLSGQPGIPSGEERLE